MRGCSRTERYANGNTSTVINGGALGFAHAIPERDGVPDDIAEPHCHREPQSHGHGERDCDGDANGNCDGRGDTVGNAKQDSNASRDEHRDANFDAERDGYTEWHRDAGFDSNRNGDPTGHSDRHRDRDSNGNGDVPSTFSVTNHDQYPGSDAHRDCGGLQVGSDQSGFR